MNNIQVHQYPVMKKPVSILTTLLLIASVSFAQPRIAQQSCTNNMISQQVDSLKAMYAKDGFVLLKEASMAMESEYEMPVIVPLNEGTWYQFIFIGEYTSRLYEVRMYDWQERQVIFRQKKWGDVDGNIITYSYVPKFSEYHMMKPVQINKAKKKGVCGYVMLFKKTGAPPTAAVSPQSNTSE